jgi:atypical dual specificity phosphatase
MIDFFAHADACKLAKHARLIQRFLLPAELGDLFRPLVGENRLSRAPANEIVPGLYLGDISASRSENFLRRSGVRCIVNCAAEIRPLSEVKRKEAGIMMYYHLIMDDVPNVDFEPEILLGIEKLAQSMVVNCGGSTLVHCAAGVSRSATIVIGYLMLHKDMPLLEAALTVKKQRHVIYPNSGFWKVLMTLEYRKRGVYSVPYAALRLHEENLSGLDEHAPLSGDVEDNWKAWLAFHEDTEITAAGAGCLRTS